MISSRKNSYWLRRRGGRSVHLFDRSLVLTVVLIFGVGSYASDINGNATTELTGVASVADKAAASRGWQRVAASGGSAVVQTRDLDLKSPDATLFDDQPSGNETVGFVARQIR